MLYCKFIHNLTLDGLIWHHILSTAALEANPSNRFKSTRLVLVTWPTDVNVVNSSIDDALLYTQLQYAACQFDFRRIEKA